MLIKALTTADIPALLSIETVANRYPWTEGVFTSCFGSQYFNFGIFANDQLLGFYFGQFIAIESQLFNICIRRDQQGNGLGGKLLTHFIAQSEQREATEAWLEVRASNVSAINLYTKLGFIEAGRRPNYYSSAGGKEDAIMMCLPLRFSN
ncbi:MAG: ribosomal-protein-alanine N-acetyltransferase [Rheinheimera sp.]|nr:ribosomal-protein-alanine N-acetyltransferase [Rheinheimera sp.]MBM35212.1 ribosomal-protein-alanine N-acetyltransferase [Rheinheimera sp.]HAW93990.1 ribosomal-protein-alanine N-acetyltransferase [Candidatus Azambacteria bacterium]|tara:strand:+ start:3025 stop:3474 length:450 start_codon:yes stop_codon:yes gene_type:complete